MDHIGERIKRARLDRGWTQDQLAASSGVTKSAISRYENGLRVPYLETAGKIADALGLPIQKLFDREQLAKILMGENDAEILNRAYNQLNSAGQSKVAEYAVDLAGNPAYQRPTDPPQAPPAAQPAPDTTPAQGGPETPPEGE